MEMDVGCWTEVRDMAHRPGTYDPRLPVAAFDFDSTLRPYRKRGPETALSLRLLALLSRGFNLVIITNRDARCKAANQEGAEALKGYVAELDDMTEGRATVYAAGGHDRDRKPHTGTWEHYVATLGRGVPPSFAFFCGDAAGRPGDHSACDYMFALNLGLAFVTPEALFGGGGAPWDSPESLGCGIGVYGPQRDLLSGVGDPEDSPEERIAELIELATGKEGPVCVVMVGSPASGKSRIAKRLVAASWEKRPMAGFTLASRDIEGNRFPQVLAKVLANGGSVVVDNTSPRREDRARALDDAAARGFTTIVCHVQTPGTICAHLNAARCQLDPTGKTKEIPGIAFGMYWKRLEDPSEDECDHLVTIPFGLAADAPPEITRFLYCH